jgi:hypothetical protein
MTVRQGFDGEPSARDFGELSRAAQAEGLSRTAHGSTERFDTAHRPELVEGLAEVRSPMTVVR